MVDELLTDLRHLLQGDIADTAAGSDEDGGVHQQRCGAQSVADATAASQIPKLHKSPCTSLPTGTAPATPPSAAGAPHSNTPRGMPTFAQYFDGPASKTTTYIAIQAMFLYLAAGFILGLRLAKGAYASSSKLPSLALGVVAMLLHSAVLYHNLFVVSGLNLGFFNALSMLLWLIAALVLLTALFQPVENIAIAVFPLAALALALELAFPSVHVVSDGTDAELRLHIAFSVLSYSLFSIAAAQATLLALQDRQLHRKRPC